MSIPVVPTQTTPIRPQIRDNISNQTMSNDAGHLRNRLTNSNTYITSPSKNYSNSPKQYNGDQQNMQPAGSQSASGTFLKEAYAFLFLFMENSSIHGFNHLTTKKRTVYDYILWFIILCLGIWGCVTISLSALERFQDNPTVISMERDYKMWNTTLPSVTLCTTKTYDEILLKKYMAKLRNVPDTEALEIFLKNLTKASYDTFNYIPEVQGNPVKPEKYLEVVHDITFNFTYELKPSAGDAPLDVVKNINERGLCHTYNTYVTRYNTYEYWAANNWSMIPMSTFTYGNEMDGDLFMNFLTVNSGAMVYIHSHSDIPDGAKRGFLYQMNTTTRFSLVALTIYSAEEVKSLTLRQRKCRFLDESNLDISPVYSYNLCRMQCRMNYVNRLCHCVPFFYRKTGKYTVCDPKGMQCIHENQDIIVNLLEKNSKKKKIKCNCLPPCDDVNYMLEQQEINFWKEKHVQSDFSWGMTKFPAMRLKRDILFGFTDLLVSVGGTAGLFLGCSVLSFMEIFYFFTLRLVLYIYNKRKGY